MPPPPSPPVEVTRRAVLTGVSVVAGSVAAGCTIGRDADGTAAPKPAATSKRAAQLDPDVGLAVAALAGEQAALDAIEAVLARHRKLRRALSPIKAAHRAHVSLLAQAAPEDYPAPTTPSLPSTSPDPFRVPPRREAALNRLSALELALSTSAKRHSFAAESGAFARLLASMAAAAAQHSVVLVPAASSSGSPEAAPQ